MTVYEFRNRAEFLNREQELEALRLWYGDPRADPILVLFGRRRVGKSWLVRQFADGKEADIFVCEETVPTSQLRRFGHELRNSVGAPVAVRSARDLFEVLFDLGQKAPRLAIIDEFPNLLTGRSKADSELAAVLENRLGSTATKIILAGSQVSSMERLLRARAPLHGRARRLVVRPLRFPEARRFLEPQHSGAELIDRYAIAGGMPRYLHQLGRRGSLRSVICADLLDPINGPLFDEPRTVLAMELHDPPVPFTILATLSAHKELGMGDLVNRSGLDRGVVSRYLNILQELYLIERADPIFSRADNRKHRYRVQDNLMRFWFTFVFPHQAALNATHDTGAFYDQVIADRLPEFVSWSYEDVSREWVRRSYARAALEVGSWWGPALNNFRRGGERTTEEIDIVGGRNGKATVIGEVKWTSGQMSAQVLADLRKYKIPALAQDGVNTSSVEILLFCKSGFQSQLRAEAAKGSVRLIDLSQLLTTLLPARSSKEPSQSDHW
jgi:AAA+ ATPase superfamily predicted ATPase